MLDTVWHNLQRVKPLYKKVLGVDLGDTRALMKDIVIRHDIVHRNGRAKDGGAIEVRPQHMIEVMTTVRTLATWTEQQLKPIPEVPTVEIAVDPSNVPF